MRISVELEGVESAVENLENRIDALNNLKEFFDDEGAEIIRRHQVEVMMTQGHGVWPPLAPSTLKRGGRRSSSPFDTSPRKMWQDLTSKNAPYHIHEATDTGLEEGTDNPVAHWHIKRRTRATMRTIKGRTPHPIEWAQTGLWVLPERRLIYWTDDLVGRFTAALMAFLFGKERTKGYQRKGVSRYGR
uniref:Tail protein n=1 Tax=viral metagenome TaxID=1070528 RepID=A0A6M3II11_9ZZZZ